MTQPVQRLNTQISPSPDLVSEVEAASLNPRLDAYLSSLSAPGAPGAKLGLSGSQGAEFFVLGYSCLHAGRYQQARDIFWSLNELWPGMAKLELGLGRAEFFCARYPLALRWVSAYLAHADDEPESERAHAKRIQAEVQDLTQPARNSP